MKKHNASGPHNPTPTWGSNTGEVVTINQLHRIPLPSLTGNVRIFSLLSSLRPLYRRMCLFLFISPSFTGSKVTHLNFPLLSNFDFIAMSASLYFLHTPWIKSGEYFLSIISYFISVYVMILYFSPSLTLPVLSLYTLLSFLLPLCLRCVFIYFLHYHSPPLTLYQEPNIWVPSCASMRAFPTSLHFLPSLTLTIQTVQYPEDY